MSLYNTEFIICHLCSFLNQKLSKNSENKTVPVEQKTNPDIISDGLECCVKTDNAAP